MFTTLIMNEPFEAMCKDLHQQLDTILLAAKEEAIKRKDTVTKLNKMRIEANQLNVKSVAEAIGNQIVEELKKTKIDFSILKHTPQIKCFRPLPKS